VGTVTRSGDRDTGILTRRAVERRRMQTVCAEGLR
jgi:hypothetical protein